MDKKTSEVLAMIGHWLGKEKLQQVNTGAELQAGDHEYCVAWNRTDIDGHQRIGSDSYHPVIDHSSRRKRRAKKGCGDDYHEVA